jgi:hypothetical protein
MHTSHHLVYIIGSFVAALIAALGIFAGSPLLYGIVPGLIGATLAGVATVRFLRHKADLAGFIATACGFIYYQAFQGNPVMLPEFSASLLVIAPVDQYVGIFLGNFTAGMLLLSYYAVSIGLKRPIQRLVPRPVQALRGTVDRHLLVGFWLVFVVVAVPNVLFGKVVVGAFKNILYQRAAWAATGEFSGFETWGGPVGASLVNMVFWSTSLFFLWIYLLGSRHRTQMLVLGPLILLWTASVALQGSRTYLVTLGFGLIVYYLGNPRFGVRAYAYAVIGFPLLFVLVQIATFYRSDGLQSIDLRDLAGRIFEIRGNEGTPSQMDGLEFFRTELVAKDAAPNPVLGVVRGLVERPVEGILMPMPRALFPWKPVDESAREYTLFFQNVRLGVPSTETFLGASPGLMGRELIRYGIFGPITVLFWLGLVLAIADKLYATAPFCAFHRIFATVLVAFFVAQMRDWVPMWFLPFLPAMLILGYVAWRARKAAPAKTGRMPVRRPEREHVADLRAIR